jgi:hypothetical protein
MGRLREASGLAIDTDLPIGATRAWTTGQSTQVTDQRGDRTASSRPLQLRRFFGTALSGSVFALLVVFGRQGDGPAWLLGVWLGLVCAISVVTVTSRRTAREWVVLSLVAIVAVVVLGLTLS